MIGRVEETRASFEAQVRASTLPDWGARGNSHPTTPTPRGHHAARGAAAAAWPLAERAQQPNQRAAHVPRLLSRSWRLPSEAERHQFIWSGHLPVAASRISGRFCFHKGVNDVPGKLVPGHIPGLAAARSYDDRDLDPLNRGFGRHCGSGHAAAPPRTAMNARRSRVHPRWGCV